MDNNEFEKNTKQNYINNLNISHAKNEALRLEQGVKSYNNNLRNSSNLNKNISKPNNNSQNSTSNRINSIRQKNAFGSNRLTNGSLFSRKNNSDSPVSSDKSETNINPIKNVGDNIRKKGLALGLLSSLFEKNKQETEEKMSDGGGTFRIPVKVKRIAFISSIPALTFVVFCVLFISSSQIYSKAIGLGNADNVSSADADKKIGQISEDKLSTETTDDDLGYVTSNVLNSSKFSSLKLSQANLILDINFQYKGKRKNFNEADLSNLEDYYSEVLDYSKKYDMDTVYMFYFKLLYIQRYYYQNYKVYLDMPLLMATLNLQSDDMGEIFASNIKDYKIYKDSDRNLKNKYFSYDYDWTGYVSTKDDSTHDIEILAQHMVAKKSADACDTPVNDVCYVVDNDQYKEFLKEFIEKKYYLDKDNEIGNNKPNTGENPENPGNNSQQQTGDWRYWKQCGFPWSNTIIPTSKNNMCRKGCFITAVTIQMARSGTTTVVSPIDPGVALNYYKFTSGNFYKGTTTNLAPNFQYYTRIILEGMSKDAIAKKLSNYSMPRYYIVLAVNDYSHYVALDYIDSSNNIFMLDPATNITDLYTKYRVESAYIYEKKD